MRVDLLLLLALPNYLRWTDYFLNIRVLLPI